MDCRTYEADVITHNCLYLMQIYTWNVFLNCSQFQLRKNVFVIARNTRRMPNYCGIIKCDWKFLINFLL
jgi:hypothetical protein